ncbi:hypothetical protein pb186bvf_013142 [Paramecium bursaria]
MLHFIQRILIGQQTLYQQTLNDETFVILLLRIFMITNGLQEIHYIFFQNKQNNHFYSTVDQFLVTNELFIDNYTTIVGLLVLNLLFMLMNSIFSYLIIYGKILFLINCITRYLIFMPSIYFSIQLLQEFQDISVQLVAVFLLFLSIIFNIYISTFNYQLQPNRILGCFGFQNVPFDIILRMLLILMILGKIINEELQFAILQIKSVIIIYYSLISYYKNQTFIILFQTHQSLMALIILLDTDMLDSFITITLIHFLLLQLIQFCKHQQLQLLLVKQIETQEEASLVHNLKCPIQYLILRGKSTHQNRMILSDFIQVSSIIKENSLYFIHLYQQAQQKPLLVLKLISQFKKYYNFRDKVIIQSINKIALYNYNQMQMTNYQIKSQVFHSQGLIQSYYESQQLLIFLQILVERKIQFLEFLIRGNYDNDCNEQIVQLSSQLYKCFIHFKNCQTIQNQQFNDLFSFKIKELYYAFIVNNFQQTIKLESQINQQLEYERGQLNQYLSNNSLYTNRSIILQTSLFKSDGILINFNQKQAQIFLESNQQTNIKHITDLMPRYIQNVHSQLFKNFIEKGESQLQIKGTNSFYVNMEGYLKPCYINLGPILLQQGIISTILTQDQKQIDYILFDLDGTIIGLTQKFQNKLNKFSKRYDDIRNRKIQEYVSINNIIQLLKQEIDNNQVIEWKVNIYRTQDSQYNINSSDQYYTQKSDQFVINNVLIPLMNQQSMTKYTTITFSTNNYSIINLKIILSFRQIHDFHYFMIQVQDFMYQDKKSIKKQKSIKNNQEFNEIPINDNINTERSHNKNNQIQINQINSYNQQFVLDNYFLELTKQIEEQTQKPHIFVNSSRNPIFSSRISNRHLILDNSQSQSQSQIQLKQVSIQPKQIIQEYNINEINQMEIEMEVEFKNLQLEEEIPKYQIKQKSKSSINEFKSLSKDDSKEVQQYTINNQSLTSVTTTKFNRISEINDLIISERVNKFTVTYLVLAVFYISFNLIEILINQSLINSETSFFLNQLDQLAPAQGMTFYTSGCISIQWVQLLQQQNFTKYSAFLNNRIKGSVAYNNYAIETGWYIAVLGLCQSQKENNIAFNVSYTNYSSDDCYSIYQSFTSELKLIYEKNKNLSALDFTGLKYDSVIRRTTIPAFNLQNQIIDIIIKAIKNQQYSTVPKFLLLLIIFLILLFSLLIIIILVMTINNRNINLITNYIINQKQQEMIDQLSGLVLVRELLKGNRDIFWWTENYSNYSLIEKQVIINHNQQSSSNFQRKREHKYRDNLSIGLVVVQQIFMIIFLIVGYYIFVSNYDQFTPSLNITYNFVKFKMRLDFTMQLGAMIKTEQFLDFNQDAVFDEGEAINIFKELIDSTLPAIDSITSNLFLIDNSEPIILQTLNDNLCLNFASSIPFCNLKSISYPYDQIDNYLNLINKGIIGLLSQLSQYASQEYTYEFQSLKYNYDKNQMLEVVQSQQFHNLFLQYLMDIQVTLYYLFTFFQSMNASLNSKMINDLYNYNYIVGSILLVIQILICFYYINAKFKETLKYKLLLTMVPYSRYQEKNVQLQILMILNQIQ